MARKFLMSHSLVALILILAGVAPATAKMEQKKTEIEWRVANARSVVPFTPAGFPLADAEADIQADFGVPNCQMFERLIELNQPLKKRLSPMSPSTAIGASLFHLRSDQWLANSRLLEDLINQGEEKLWQLKASVGQKFQSWGRSSIRPILGKAVAVSQNVSTLQWSHREARLAEAKFDSNTILYAFPAATKTDADSLAEQVKVVSISDATDIAYWEYYGACDYWNVNFDRARQVVAQHLATATDNRVVSLKNLSGTETDQGSGSSSLRPLLPNWIAVVSWSIRQLEFETWSRQDMMDILIPVQSVSR